MSGLMLISRSRRPCSGGSSLTELLVVIGVIGALLALLLPTIAAARRQAQLVGCASNLRQIGSFASIWASEHRGFLPLDGEVEIPLGTSGMGSLPGAVQDAHRLRYAYHFSADDPNPPITVERPVPLFVALLRSNISDAAGLSQIVPDTQWSRTEALFSTAQMFRCPSARPHRFQGNFDGWQDGVFEGGPTIILISGRLRDATIWYTNRDFATNGGLLGFHFDPQFAQFRLRGHVTSVRNASRMLLCADSGGVAPRWIPSLGSNRREVSLADVLASSSTMPYATPFDRIRHGGRLNILFLDGHVEARRIDKSELKTCYLLQP